MKNQYLILAIIIFVCSCDSLNRPYFRNKANNNVYFYCKFDTTNFKYYHVTLTKALTTLFIKDTSAHLVMVDTVNLTALYKLKPFAIVHFVQMGGRPYFPFTYFLTKNINSIKTYNYKEFIDAFNRDDQDEYYFDIE